MGSSQEPKGMLFALMSPGGNTLEDFTTWYDEDHAPSRASVPGVLSATRFQATDNASPEWLAVYELTSPAVLASEPYTKLWQTASSYERDLLDRTENTSRRVYSLLTRKSSPKWERNKQRVFHTVGLQPREGSGMTDKELDRWYEEEHIDLLSEVPGWLRSTRWKLEDVKGANLKEIDARKVSRFIAIHEWDSDAVFQTKEMQLATSTPWRTKVMERVDPISEERRQFALWKDFPADSKAVEG